MNRWARKIYYNLAQQASLLRVQFLTLKTAKLEMKLLALPSTEAAFLDSSSAQFSEQRRNYYQARNQGKSN